MKTLRNTLFLVAVVLVLLVGVTVSVRSIFGTSAGAIAAPASAAVGAQYQRSSQPYYVPAVTAAALAAGSLYQRSSQPYYVPAVTAASLDTSDPFVRRALGVAAGR